MPNQRSGRSCLSFQGHISQKDTTGLHSEPIFGVYAREPFGIFEETLKPLILARPATSWRELFRSYGKAFEL